MTTPRASVIVPSYRGVQRLPALLDAFAAQQDGTPDFEVIVVVDGVDDGSPALLAAEQRFPVRAIVFPENRGRVAALNAGFHAASGDVLIRCDDDLVPAPDYITLHVGAHAEGSVGAIGLYRNQLEPTPYSAVYGEAADEDFRRGAFTAPEEIRWRYWHGNVSITREIWEAVGEYDPAYRLYGWEDVDYGYRIADAGFPVVIVPELDTVHRVAAVTTQIRVRRAIHAGSARRIFERKFPQSGLPPAVPPLSLWNALVRVSAAVLARAAGPVTAVVDRVLPRLPRAVSHKLVALSVEAAGVAGYRHPERAKEQF